MDADEGGGNGEVVVEGMSPYEDGGVVLRKDDLARPEMGEVGGDRVTATSTIAPSDTDRRWPLNEGECETVDVGVDVAPNEAGTESVEVRVERLRFLAGEIEVRGARELVPEAFIAASDFADSGVVSVVVLVAAVNGVELVGLEVGFGDIGGWWWWGEPNKGLCCWRWCCISSKGVCGCDCDCDCECMSSSTDSFFKSGGVMFKSCGLAKVWTSSSSSSSIGGPCKVWISSSSESSIGGPWGMLLMFKFISLGGERFLY